MVDASVLAELLSQGPSKGARAHDAFCFLRVVMDAVRDGIERLATCYAAENEVESLWQRAPSWQPSYHSDPRMYDDPFLAAFHMFRDLIFTRATNGEAS